MALSIVKSEYVTSNNSSTQVLRVKHQLQDYHVNLGCVSILCDNTSTINLSKNFIQYAHTKYIEVRHHFLRDHVAKGDFELIFIETSKQLADIFTKLLSEDSFCSIRRELGMCCIHT